MVLLNWVYEIVNNFWKQNLHRKNIIIMKVHNMKSPRSGNPVPNQFIIVTDEGTMFQSYGSIIAFIRRGSGKTELGKNWNYSRTTTRYRNIFLNESTKETRAKLASGQYILNENL
jgi:hypothetical protein